MMSPITRQSVGALFVLLVLAGFTSSDMAYEAIPRGNEFYAIGEYSAAAEQYAIAAAGLPDKPEIRFNQGAAFFKLHDNTKAVEHFALALGADDTKLQAQARYNIGNVRYEIALISMNTYQDAVTPLKEAIGHYRDALSLDPGFEDARYNLELAHRLLKQLQDQNVLPQPNPEIRNQQASQNRGQTFDDDSVTDRATEEDAERGDSDEPQGQQGEQTGSQSGQSSTQAEAPKAASQQELSPQEAEQMVDIIRNRARAAQEKRDQWRQARMREAKVEKIW